MSMPVNLIDWLTGLTVRQSSLIQDDESIDEMLLILPLLRPGLDWPGLRWVNGNEWNELWNYLWLNMWGGWGCQTDQNMLRFNLFQTAATPPTRSDFCKLILQGWKKARSVLWKPESLAHDYAQAMRKHKGARTQGVWKQSDWQPLGTGEKYGDRRAHYPRDKRSIQPGVSPHGGRMTRLTQRWAHRQGMSRGSQQRRSAGFGKARGGQALSKNRAIRQRDAATGERGGCSERNRAVKHRSCAVS